MKKRVTEGDWIAFERKQQKSRLKEIKRRNVVLKLLRANRINKTPKRLRRPSRGTRILYAPENFSFINNTEELIKFFNRMEKIQSKGFDVDIDFSGIKALTPDSLAVLVATMDVGRFSYGRICKGNEPADEDLKRKFTSSGLYDVVRSSGVRVEPTVGRFQNKKSKKVDSVKSNDLIKFVTTRLYKKPVKCGGVTNALLESMLNTRGHAAGSGSRYETWWVAAQCDISRKQAYYSFVDTGVGIFKSKQPSILREALSKLMLTSNSQLLKKMLHRQIPSSTGIPYRGRGLPSIFKSLKRGDIANLIIITNDVYANVSEDEYRRITPEFSGTFLYWEYPGERHGKAKPKRAA